MVEDLLSQTQLDQAKNACEYSRHYVFAELSIAVKSNHEALLAELDHYYKSYLQAEPNLAPQKTLYVVEQEVVGDQLDWLEVPREAGKQGRKEGYLDDAASGGRWIKKFKTGLSLLQHQETPVVLGPCSVNLAQIVNFINNQFLNHYLCQGFELGHAAAFSQSGKVTAIAAGSGGGKSTMMLRCLENEQRNFITNDRLLFKREGDQVKAVGLAKLPRVNPGTLLNAERLKHILPPARQAELAQMPTSELWSLEEKYDVQIEDEYGAGRVELSGKLENLVMLDWRLDATQPTTLEAVDLSATPEVIEGLRKRPGPFFQHADASFSEDLNDIVSLAQYCETLTPVKVYRLTGKIDFDRAFELLESL